MYRLFLVRSGALSAARANWRCPLEENRPTGGFWFVEAGWRQQQSVFLGETPWRTLRRTGREGNKRALATRNGADYALKGGMVAPIPGVSIGWGVAGVVEVSVGREVSLTVEVEVLSWVEVECEEEEVEEF